MSQRFYRRLGVDRGHAGRRVDRHLDVFRHPGVTGTLPRCTAEGRRVQRRPSIAPRGHLLPTSGFHSGDAAGYPRLESPRRHRVSRSLIATTSYRPDSITEERAPLRNRGAMTRRWMGTPMTGPQDAPERWAKPTPPTSGERVLKPTDAPPGSLCVGKPCRLRRGGCHSVAVAK